MTDVLSTSELEALHAYWCAANYLSVGQIYLLDNPLLLRSRFRQQLRHSVRLPKPRDMH